MLIGCGIDFYFMYLLPWDEGAVVFVLTIASVSFYLSAKAMSGVEMPKSKNAFTIEEIKMIPSLLHVLAHVFVSVAHVFLLYWCAHGSNGSIIGVDGTEIDFNHWLSLAAGIVSLASYFFCITSKTESKRFFLIIVI